MELCLCCMRYPFWFDSEREVAPRLYWQLRNQGFNHGESMRLALGEG